MRRPEQVEGYHWLCCDRPWDKSERRALRRRRRNGYRKQLKKEAKRLMRALGKLLGDDAPRRVPFRGWEY